MKANYEFLEEMLEDVGFGFEEKLELIVEALGEVNRNLLALTEVVVGQIGEGGGFDGDDLGADEGEERVVAPGFKVGIDGGGVSGKVGDLDVIARIFGNL